MHDGPVSTHKSALRHKGGDWPICQITCPHRLWPQEYRSLRLHEFRCRSEVPMLGQPHSDPIQLWGNTVFANSKQPAGLHFSVFSKPQEIGCDCHVGELPSTRKQDANFDRESVVSTFFSVKSTTRSRCKQKAFIEWQRQSQKDSWTGSGLGCSRRENNSSQVVWSWSWGWGEKLGKHQHDIAFQEINQELKSQRFHVH